MLAVGKKISKYIKKNIYIAKLLPLNISIK